MFWRKQKPVAPQPSRWPTMAEQRAVFEQGRADAHAGKFDRDLRPYLNKYFQAYAYLCGKEAGLEEVRHAEIIACMRTKAALVPEIMED